MRTVHITVIIVCLIVFAVDADTFYLISVIVLAGNTVNTDTIQTNLAEFRFELIHSSVHIVIYRCSILQCAIEHRRKFIAGHGTVAAEHAVRIAFKDAVSCQCSHIFISPKDAHAVSVGAFYRPNEDTMFSVGGSFGGGENMVNAGVSVKLGQGNHVSTSRVALAKEVEDLKAIVKAQSAEIKAMRGAMQSGASVMKDVNFPDVPKDHWAYSYVKSLADRGLLEGYPDGEFKGDRSMTRYEFAAIIYRALQNGAPIDSDMAKAIGEFEPEINRIKDLDRIRVDRISGKDNDRHKVERVRVNNESNKETGDYRDVYGSHISPEA